MQRSLQKNYQNNERKLFMNNRYSKLTFIRQCNPIYEDYCKKYSTVRFYSETIVSLAKNLEIPEIEILYFNETYPSDTHSGKETEARIWFENLKKSDDSVNEIDYPTFSMYKSAKRNDIKLDVKNISCHTETNFENSLVVISFMTDTPAIHKKYFNKTIIPIVNQSAGFIYLASDNEYSGYAYRKDEIVINCLEFIGDYLPEDFIRQMKCIIMTESNCLGLRNSLIQKFHCPVFYCPMIIDPQNLRFNTKTYKQFTEETENKIAMLKNLNTFMIYQDFFETIRDHGVVFESSMPNTRKKYAPFCEKYGLQYKNARFWKMEEFEHKISPYRVFLGMSTIGSSRFTSKILEGTNAGCIVINPYIDLEGIGFSAEEYPICNSTLQDSGILDVLTIDRWTQEECSKSLADAANSFLNYDYDEYTNRLLHQVTFIKKYFLEDSPCVQECLQKIIPFLKEN